MLDRREKYCSDQIRRLKSLDFFPTDDYASGELVKVLWRSSESDSHAERIIDKVLEQRLGDNGRSCPTPAELREIAESVNPSERRPVARSNCPRCFGMGWEPVETVAAEGAFAGQKYQAVRPCQCKKHGLGIVKGA
jgi:hypothetical protein